VSGRASRLDLGKPSYLRLPPLEQKHGGGTSSGTYEGSEESKEWEQWRIAPEIQPSHSCTLDKTSGSTSLGLPKKRLDSSSLSISTSDSTYGVPLTIVKVK
jgi:hypothetical protein